MDRTSSLLDRNLGPSAEFNVLDKFKYLDQKEVAQSYQDSSLPFVIALKNLTSDFNKSSAIRNANNFGARAVVLIGNKHWDRRGAVGTHNYIPVLHASNTFELFDMFPGYSLVAAENNVPSESLLGFRFPDLSIILFGEETLGLAAEDLALADYVVAIPSMGTVRSINVASAAGIMSYEYVRQR